jgi:predicted nucleic acid-binding protein
VAIVQFDSSALVELVLDESGSDPAAELWNACDAALSSRLAYPEVCSALAAAGRNHDLAESEASAAADEWEIFWSSMRPIELSADVEGVAGELAVLHRLRGADAVHLASALALGSPEVTVAVWDKRLHGGAAAVGLPVAPRTLD